MKVLLRSFNLALLLGIGITLSAQTVPAGLSAMLNHTLDSMRDELNAKSFSAAIQLPDGAVWAHADGVSSVVPLVSVTPDDAYLIGSVTKTLTAACVLQLADEGVLNLDDAIGDWLDTLPYVNPDITISQLLQHTSGLYDLLNNPAHHDSLMADMSRIWTAEELIERFMAAPLAPPGDGWSYCNTNYFLLSMIIKQATGNSFHTEIRNRFFTSLALESFAVPSLEPMSSPVAHLWLDINGDAILDDAHDFYFNYLALNSAVAPAGGYYATASDCSKWMRAYMRGDLLSSTMMAHAKTTVFASGSPGGLYGLGMMKNTFLGLEAYGHAGDLAYHASSWYFPALDISISVLTNDNNKNSWALLPVVTELLRSYIAHNPTAIATAAVPAMSAKAWPNPFTEKFTVDISSKIPLDNVEVSVRDVMGRSINAPYTTQLTSNGLLVNINHLSALNAGLYFVHIKPERTEGVTIKMVK